MEPANRFTESATYVISGGLGGIGRSIARWMASRGAKNLILLSRFGPRNEAAHNLTRELRDQGVHVEAPACDIANHERLRSVLGTLGSTMPSIRGCINSSMLLKVSQVQSHFSIIVVVSDTLDNYTSCRPLR